MTPLVTRPGIALLFTGRRTRTAYYSSRARDDAGGGQAIFAVDIDSGVSRKVADVPAGTIGSINADETLLLGQVALGSQDLRPDGTRQQNRRAAGRAVGPGEYDYAATGKDGKDGKPLRFADAKEVRLNERLEGKIPMEIFTIEIRTGARKVVTASTDWRCAGRRGRVGGRASRRGLERWCGD